jgi:hypothetical protein
MLAWAAGQKRRRKIQRELCVTRAIGDSRAILLD